MPHFGDEIAVLDGYDKVISASQGGNYGGGSSYAPRTPLMPSTVGLASADEDLMQYFKMTPTPPPRQNVIDASQGGNYSGGSSYADGIPLMPSSVGLAECPGCGVGEMEAAYGSSLEIEDGRMGRGAGTGEKAYRVSHQFEERKNVIDPSQGGNYTGGSSYAPRLPLMVSSVGLAGLDSMSDMGILPGVAAAKKAGFKKVAGKKRLQRLKGHATKIAGSYMNMPPSQKAKALKKLELLNRHITHIRSIRHMAAAKIMAARQGLTVQQYLSKKKAGR